MLPLQRLSQKELKLYASLQVKKYRELHHLFIAEGIKVIEETISLFEIEAILVTSEKTLDLLRSNSAFNLQKVRLVDDKEMARLSALDRGKDIITIYKIPDSPQLSAPQGLYVALDTIQNPGNMGTIIRLCDWLGIRHILCGTGCVDIYNPKVVQATAGALGSVIVHENVDLTDILPRHFKVICGTKMEGTPLNQISQHNPNEPTCILFGNEGHGISADLQSICTDFYSIPAAPSSTTDSLNVGISAAIILSKLTGLT
ncbi:RNA methyltransferase [Porphyromonas sp.]|uniref:TrmH family RNA methyltransferase n=1 Tax=Porphyromonas sp. TaxID=1924944 RepID=UPI0026DC84A6|nr:RNA methyltransferase [Porphyromonas sp.]MDO4770715.1 RNA methyltransferase [Porphyromonas sp.]